MKNYIFASILSVFCIYGLSLIKTKKSESTSIEPITIVLQDSARSTTLECTKVSGVWRVTAGDAAAYLERVCESFNSLDAANFDSIELRFSSDYAKGSISGIGLLNGSAGTYVPVGVNFTGPSVVGSLHVMPAGEAHTCAGNPCSCCKFTVWGAHVVGCNCISGVEGCQEFENPSCNHTVTYTR